jgi:hypothetical protein
VEIRLDDPDSHGIEFFCSKCESKHLGVWQDRDHPSVTEVLQYVCPGDGSTVLLRAGMRAWSSPPSDSLAPATPVVLRLTP